MARALVLLAKGFEEIEAVTVVDVLRRAGVEVQVVSIAEKEVCGSHNVTVVADGTFQEAKMEDLDLVFLPGGMEGMERLAADPRVGDLLGTHLQRGGKVAAICAATCVFRAHDLIPSSTRITSHPGVAEDLKEYSYVEDRVVMDGNIITSRGPGTAMDLALTLAEELAGAETRAELEAAMLTGGG